MTRTYFEKTVHGLWDQKRTFVRYIVSPKEWDKVNEICELMSKHKDLKRISESIQKFSRDYKKSYETEPEMPEGSHSFILFDKEASLFEEICLTMFFEN